MQVFTLRIPPELLVELRSLAHAKNVPPSVFVRRLIELELSSKAAVPPSLNVPQMINSNASPTMREQEFFLRVAVYDWRVCLPEDQSEESMADSHECGGEKCQ